VRYRLIACEILYREFCDAIARSPHIIDVEFHPKALHDRGAKAMQTALQVAIDQAEGYDAVLLGYALCGNGIAGLTARRVPLVAPRAHDCIGLLMGSRAKFEQYFQENSGVYFRSTGWLERGSGMQPFAQMQTGVGMSLMDLIEKYGEESGRYLFEELTRYKSNYRKLAYVDTGLQSDDACADMARGEADGKGWEFERIPGNLDLFRRLAAGDWDERDFLIVPPGGRIEPSHTESIIRIEGGTS
jgi:hypothetical protein